MIMPFEIKLNEFDLHIETGEQCGCSIVVRDDYNDGDTTVILVTGEPANIRRFAKTTGWL